MFVAQENQTIFRIRKYRICGLLLLAVSAFLGVTLTPSFAAPLDCTADPSLAACQTNTGATVFDVVARTDYADGAYSMKTQNGTTIAFEIYTFEDDVVYSSTPTLCSATADTHMCILKYEKNLTIGSGVTLTPQVRKKGLTIFVNGTLTNNGVISMTARGAIAAGQDVQLYDLNGTYQTVPATGSTGGTISNYCATTAAWVGSVGSPGVVGSGRGSGGGGSGSGFAYGSGRCAKGGNGATGTSYSGGPGGGGATNGQYSAGTTATAGNGAANGGAGGKATLMRGTGGNDTKYAGGGAGNNGGQGYYSMINTGATATGIASATYSGQNGTGGLLSIFAQRLVNSSSAVISSNGSSGGLAVQNSSAPGGGSGGGSINLFYKTSSIAGTVSAAGGSGGRGDRGYAGAGGAGTVTSTELPDTVSLDLATLTTSKGTLSPAFSPNITSYVINGLATDDTSLALAATSADTSATITGTGMQTVSPATNTYEVTVTAPDGFWKTYTITASRPPSAVATPASIAIHGLIPNLCALDEAYCIIDPTLDPTLDMYEMTVPYRIASLDFEFTPSHPYQQIEGDGTQSLDEGLNTIIVTVTAEDGVTTMTYLFVINRDLPMNADIASLTISNTLSPFTGFDKDTTEYFVEVAADQSSLDMSIVLDDPAATYQVYGNSNFTMGLSDVTIRVTSVKGTEKIYVVHVDKAASSDNYLSALSVTSPDNALGYTLSPLFQRSIRTYSTSVPGDVASVDIVATPATSTSTITGDGAYSLVSGNNPLSITVTAENGDIGIYTLNVIKAKNQNARLSSLSALEGTLVPAFHPDTLVYTMDVEADVSSLSLTAIPEVSTSRTVITGNRNFIMGDRNTVSIVVRAESGVIRTYQIKVNKSRPSNTYLADLLLGAGTLSPAFDRATTSYTASVPATTASVLVTGVKEEPTSFVNGNGSYDLAYGANGIDITVAAQSGDERTYHIDITREASTNADLLGIENDASAVMTPAFSSSITDYVINVGNGVTDIAFAALRADPRSTVSGVASRPLATGSNPIVIEVTAQDGVTKKIFNINVVRDYSTNANLASIFAAEGALIPAFDPMVIRYDLALPGEYDHLTLDITPEFPGASHTVSGNSAFALGENIVTIHVISEAGEPYAKDYVIYVDKQAPESTSNHLSALSVDQGVLSPAFSRDAFVYDVTVARDIAAISVSATPEDPAAGVTGTGPHALAYGQNILPITITSVDGKTRDYQIRVFRQRPDEARLASLSLVGDSLAETFSPDTFAYTLSTLHHTLDLSAAPIDPDASYEILGNTDFALGANTVTIRVTAADGATTQDYTITASRLPSSNNNLVSLSVSTGALTPLFNKAITLYSVAVPATANNILVSATSEDPAAGVTGTGPYALSVGLNTITLTVTSESGTPKDYIILLTKAASTNNFLSSLAVSDGSLTPAFDRDINTYDLEVEYDTATLTLDGTPEDNRASVTGLGSRPLSVGLNTLDILVVSQSGALNTYRLNVTREQINSARLSRLESAEASFAFDPAVSDYIVSVPNEIAALSLVVETLDPAATYTVSGNSDFVIGMNTIEILVTARDGATTQLYTLSVNRQLSANNFLEWLMTDHGTLSPAFDKYTMSYTLSVPSEIEIIDIDVGPEVSSSTVFGDGLHVLSPGVNDIDITVISATGIERTYQLSITRAKSSVATLSSLDIRHNGTLLPLSPAFSPLTNIYDVSGVLGQTSVDIYAEPTVPSATISGLGAHSVVAGENTYVVSVTAEDGTINTYTINLLRPSSTDSSLSSLVPSSSALVPAFDPGVTEYTIDISDTTSLISFAATATSSAATITNPSPVILSDGANIANILVTAEDGVTVTTYTITINRHRNNEARLSSLSIAGHTLDPIFDPDTYTYSLTLPGTATSFSPSDISATALDPAASIAMSPALDLSVDPSSTLTRQFIITITAADGFTTQLYIISISRLPSFSTTITSHAYTINRTDPTDPTLPSPLPHLIGIYPATTISSFLEGIDNPSSHLKLFDATDTTEITDPTAYIGTGNILKLIVGGTTYDTLTLIVRGDANGDGIITIADFNRLNNYLSASPALPYYQLAMDLNKDGLITIADFNRLNNYLSTRIGDGDIN